MSGIEVRTGNIETPEQRTEPEARRKTIRIRNVGGDSTVRDLLQLFSRQSLRVGDVRLELAVPRSLRSVEAFVTVPACEAEMACDRMNGRFWRGQRLSVTVEADHER